MIISRVCKWWIDNLEVSFKLISHGKPNREIFTDSSKTGWGGGALMTKSKDLRRAGHRSKKNKKATLMI